MAKDLAIVLNNGSINSAVITAMAAQKYRPILLRAESVEQPGSPGRAAYDQQVAHYRPYREHTLSMPYLSLVQSSVPQVPNLSDPRMRAPLGPQMLELMPLIGVAIRFATHYQAAAVYVGLRIGSNADELAQAMEYAQIWNELIQIPCGQTELELVMPLLELEAWQVIDVGYQVHAPFERTRSCLADSMEPCWACRGCRARESAFGQSGKPDPLRAVKRP
jgi:hypothetical protein